MARVGKGTAEPRTWTVRELADECEVTTRTLRFYESQGLLAPERVGRMRIYSARDHARLHLILRGRRFGMSLGEIAEIVTMYDGAESSERRQLRMLLARLDEIAADLRARQRDLRRTLGEVDDVTARCRDRLEHLSRPSRNRTPPTTNIANGRRPNAAPLQRKPRQGTPPATHTEPGKVR